MRGHLAAAIDIDANIDTAEIGGIEPDLETALAASRRGGDLECNPAQRHGGIGCRPDAEGSDRRGRGRRGGAVRRCSSSPLRRPTRATGLSLSLPASLPTVL